MSYRPSQRHSSNGFGSSQNTHPATRVALNTDNDVPNAVRQLLLSTRQLQDLLKQWSLGQVSEEQVSDCYVEVGTWFNAALRTFAWWGIDLSDIHSIPQELRTVLEQCLGEDPSPAALNSHLSQIRKVLYRLLKGLQAKQDAWKLAGGGSPLIGASVSPMM